jgi:hypothetical protein
VHTSNEKENKTIQRAEKRYIKMSRKQNNVPTGLNAALNIKVV